MSLNLNSLKFTTHTNFNGLKSAIFKVLEENYFILKHNNKKMNYYSFTDDSGVESFSLKITNTNYYTFSFKMLNCTEEFESHKAKNIKERDSLNNHLYKFSKKNVIHRRIGCFKALLSLLKEQTYTY